MPKKTEYFLRYLKTYLNNTNYSYVVLDDASDFISIPLYEYVNETNCFHDYFLIENTPEKLRDIKGLNKLSPYKNLLSSFNFNASDLIKSSTDEWQEIITKNQTNTHDQIQSELFNKFDYYISKSKLSPFKNGFYLGLGQLNIKLPKDRLSIPIIIQEVSIEKDTSIKCSLIGKPFINIDGIRKIPNLSIQTIKVIKEINQELNSLSINESYISKILEKVYEALGFTNHRNLSLLNTVTLFSIDKQLNYNDLVNTTLKNNDISKDSVLAKVFSKNTLENGKFVDIDALDDLFKTLKTEQIALIDKVSASNSDEFINNLLLKSCEENDSILVLSKLKFDKNKYQHVLRNGLYDYSIEDQTASQQYKTIEETLRRKIFSFIQDENGDEINLENGTNEILDYDELWQENVVYRKGLLKELSAALNTILIDVFRTHPFTITIAEDCSDSPCRKKWEVLLNSIETYKKYRKNALENSATVTFSSHISRYQEDVLAEILEFLNKNNKLPSFGFSIKSSWRTFTQEITVDGKVPQNTDDFIAITDQLLMNKSKEKLSNLWNELMVPLDIAELSKDDEVLEKQVNSYFNTLRVSISWYEKKWKPIFDKLINAGFNWQRFLTENMNRYIENGLINLLLNGGVKDLRKIINYQVMKISHGDASLSKEFEPDDSILLLDNIKNELVNIKNTNKKLVSKPDLNIDVILLHEFLDFINSLEKKIDLLIIDSAEFLDMKDLLLLAYCKKAIVLGDSRIKKFSYDEFENYVRIFSTLLPDVYPDFFSGEFTLFEILTSFEDIVFHKKSFVEKTPAISSFLNKLAKKTISISNMSLGYPLINRSFEYKNNWQLELLSNLYNFTKNNQQETSLSIFVDDEKVARHMSQEIYSVLNNDITKSNVYSRSNLESMPFSDYILVMDQISQKQMSSNLLYTLATKAKKQLFYINNSNFSSIHTNMFEEVNNNTINIDPRLDTLLFNNNIFAKEKLTINNVNIDLLTFTKTPYAIVNANEVKNNIDGLMGLMEMFSVVVYFDKLDGLESLLSSFENVYTSNLSKELGELFDIKDKEKKEFVIRESSKITSTESFGYLDDINTRSYIIKNEQKPSAKDSDEDIQVESIDNTDTVFLKSENAFFEDVQEDDETLPQSQSFIEINEEPPHITKETTHDVLDNKENQAGSFDLIEFLDGYGFKYYDQRPSGSLYVLNTKNFSSHIEALSDFGYNFQIAIGEKSLPTKDLAWKLIN
jgi:hypothetical protein